MASQVNLVGLAVGASVVGVVGFAVLGRSEGAAEVGVALGVAVWPSGVGAVGARVGTTVGCAEGCVEGFAVVEGVAVTEGVAVAEGLAVEGAGVGLVKPDEAQRRSAIVGSAGAAPSSSANSQAAALACGLPNVDALHVNAPDTTL